jgi:predicted N-acetyltransferase YhbS
MQIRVATRQDEPPIRTIVFEALAQSGIAADLQGPERDLINTDGNYFWHDGLCLAAEDDGRVVGVLAARKHKSQEDVLELCRLAVAPAARRQGAARSLVDTMLFFAGNMEYKTIICTLPGRSLAEIAVDAEIMKRLGFGRTDAGVWLISL